LFGHAAEPCLQMHPRDMAERGLRAGDLVQMSSRRGALLVPVQPDDTLTPSQLFMAMHWGGEYLGGTSMGGTSMSGVNALTTPALCPGSKQPELKHTAVKLQKAELPWTLLAMA